MILSEILTYVKDNYTYDSDIANSLGEAPTDTQLIPYVNWAVRTIARKTRQISIYIPITLVAGQGSYNLNAGSAISSTNASQVGNNLLLYPAPSSNVSSGSGNYLVAEYLPANLTISDLSNSPDLPVELHEAVAYLAAIKIAAPQITEAESYQRLQLYNSFINESIQEVKKQNEQTIQDFGSTFGWGRPKWIRW